ncbi:putative membrane protein SirB2 [Dongia mobilis]|uniref:Putative membrane protein SirB2 n=1 Tax=Dongia mobilis TaxID=578943 RepID=A0A4R6WNA0_9PROT|nr:SirB2 family protein [Dongia mobilis]TDQ80430.1 putative membrane protein SirB2 [Dongia mobilis]
MTLDSLYPALRFAHVTAVALSGFLFLLRGLAREAGAPWAMALPLRLTTYAIDTVLLASALLLMVATAQYPASDAWLSVKLLLVLLYIVLGSFALKRARGIAARRLCFLAALLVFAFVVGIARSRDPLGLLAFIRS